MTQTTRITLLRHGHVHNPENLIYGRMPGFRLSAEGRQQVQAAAQVLNPAAQVLEDAAQTLEDAAQTLEDAAQQLDASPLAAIYSSPQLRAQQSAEIVGRYYPDLAIRTAPLINEIRCYFEGNPAEEVRARGWDLYTGVPEGYETPPDIGERGGEFVTQTRERHPGQHVLAVSHGDVIAFTVLWAMNEPLKVALKRTLDRFGITDRYPATASLTSLIYHTDDPDEVPAIEYVRPYDDRLVLDALS
jgi:broad specificity phosphatase PhoE